MYSRFGSQVMQCQMYEKKTSSKRVKSRGERIKASLQLSLKNTRTRQAKEQERNNEKLDQIYSKVHLIDQKLEKNSLI
jgi:hypothetical protein